MSLKRYEALVYSVETGTFSKAGEKLGTSQSAITHLISDLEKQVNFQLVTRTKKGVNLTATGKKIYPYIKEVVVANENLIARINKLNTENSVIITVGTFTSVAVNWLPVIINGFKTLHPEVSFKIIDGGYSDIINAVETGVADIGFISTDEKSDTNTFPLYNDKIFAVLPTDHKYADLDNFPVKNFSNEPVISLSESTDFDYRRIFENANIKPDIRYRTADDYAMISMVENHLGICLIPELLIKNRTVNVKFIELDPPQYRTIALKTAEGITPIVEEFKDYIINWVKTTVIQNNSI